MFSIRYIHAADLHLDAAFRGLGRVAETAELSKQLHASTFTALDRLINLCEKESPDFLVLAGDVYNEEDQSLKAQIYLRDACERLNAIGIKVFIAHGNHDPLSSRLKMIKWPENTIIFNETVQSHIIKRQGQEVAVVHGISHASAKESRNLAKAFSRLTKNDNIFQLGVLHCTLENSIKADRYAPCTLEDLKNTKLDAWALGHVHEGRVINQDPFVAYSGNIQGLHIAEAGPKGCLIVSVSPVGTEQASQIKQFEIESKFHTLSPVIWQSLDVDLNNVELLDDVEQRIIQAAEETTANADPECTSIIFRVKLKGRLELDYELRKAESLNNLLERVRENLPTRPYIWLKDIILETSPLLSLESLSTRDDLLGETLRLGNDLGSNEDSLQNIIQTSLAPLFTHHKAKQILQIPQGEDAHDLLEEARRLCADMMESR